MKLLAASLRASTRDSFTSFFVTVFFVDLATRANLGLSDTPLVTARHPRHLKSRNTPRTPSRWATTLFFRLLLKQVVSTVHPSVEQGIFCLGSLLRLMYF